MTAGRIPPSPYPVLQETRKPTRYIDGPYIASKPAYMMFAEQARTGAHISDMIAEDMRNQAKVEGRPDPVKEMPENRHHWWVNDGVVEALPQWKNANDPPKPADTAPAAPDAAPAVPAPIAPAPAPVLPGPVLPAPVVPVGGPAKLPVVPPPAGAAPAAPAPDLEAAPPAQAARVASASPSKTSALRRPIASKQVSAVQQQLAQASYAKPSKSARLAQRAAVRSADPKTGSI